MTLRSLLLLSVLASLGCGASDGRSTLPSEPVTAARLFPMVMGAVWSYHIDTGTALPALGILRVVRVEGDEAALAPDAGEQTRYRREREGVRVIGAEEAWVLREPIAVGTEWTGRGGRRARIAAIGLGVSVPGGAFSGCVRVEEVGASNRIDQATVYCPDVGPVIVESETFMDTTREHVRVRAELLGYTTPATSAPND